MCVTLPSKVLCRNKRQSVGSIFVWDCQDRLCEDYSSAKYTSSIMSVLLYQTDMIDVVRPTRGETYNR